MSGCTKNKDSKNVKNAKETANGGGTGGLGLNQQMKAFDISDEKQFFQVKLTGASEGELTNEDLINRHKDHLYRLANQGILDSCWAMNDGRTGYQVLVANSEEEVRSIIEKDPILLEGHYKAYEIEKIAPKWFPDQG